MNHTRMLKMLSLLTVIGAGVFNASSGQVIVENVGANLPENDVLYAQLPGGVAIPGALTWRWTQAYSEDPLVKSNRRDIGQFFDVTTTVQIYGIGLYTAAASVKAEDMTRSFTLSIVKVTGLSVDGGMTSSSTIDVLTSYQGDLIHLGVGGVYVQFTFDPYVLDIPEAGSRYAFLFSFDEAVPAMGTSVGNFFYMPTYVPEGSVPGFYINYENETNSPVQTALDGGVNAGRGFQHYILGSVLIPEPSQYAMMAGAALMLMTILVRRFKK